MSIAKHAGYNLVGGAIPILVSLITVPIYVKVIGLERYGLLSVCWLLLGYFGLFDLGLGRAASQRIAALRDRPDEERSLVFWTALTVTLLLSAAAMAVLWPAAAYGLPLIQTRTAELRLEIVEAVPWLAACVPLALISGVFNGALSGRERFGFVNIVDASSNLMMSVLPLSLAWFLGPSLKLLILASLGARTLVLIALFWGARRWVPAGRWHFDRRMAGSLLRYGGWISVSGGIGPLLAFWDRFAIGALAGAAAVSVYVIPFTLVWRLALVPQALSGALFPRFAAVEEAQAGQLQKDSIAALSVLMTPLVVAAVCGLGPFLVLWLGHRLGAAAAPVAYLLLPGIWVNSFAQVAYSRLQAQGRPNVVATIHAAEILPYGALLYGAILVAGLEGAAAIWTLRVTVDAALLFWFSERDLSRLRWLAGPALVVVLAASAALILPMESPLRWLLLALLLAAALFLSYRMRPQHVDASVRKLLRRLRPHAVRQP